MVTVSDGVQVTRGLNGHVKAAFAVSAPIRENNFQTCIPGGSASVFNGDSAVSAPSDVHGGRRLHALDVDLVPIWV